MNFLDSKSVYILNGYSEVSKKNCPSRPVKKFSLHSPERPFIFAFLSHTSHADTIYEYCEYVQWIISASCGLPLYIA